MDTYKKLFAAIIILFFISFLSVGCAEKNDEKISVKPGADVLLLEHLDLIKNNNLGIVTNHTAILNSGIHLVDALKRIDDISIVALFGPEHGIRGDAPDGITISDGKDSKTGIPVYSLYGATRQPTQEMLENVDILIFDIQDIGARFYTYISTMYYTIKAAAENNIPVIILDRPNPINGVRVEGPMLDPEYKTFVGIAEMPIRHGMTIGELSLFFNRTEILGTDKPADLKVIKMKNWKREYYFDDCNIPWVKPSPNMPNLETAIVYPGLCLIEGTNISEGRGTYSPFLTIGSPYINSEEVISEINKFNIDGVQLSDTSYTPVAIPNMASSPKYESKLCNGINIKVTDRERFQPIEFAVKLIYTIHKMYPEDFTFRERSIDRLWGSTSFREAILSGATPDVIIDEYQKKLEEFKNIREQFLLY